MSNGTATLVWGAAIAWILFGLFMSIGWAIGGNVVNFIGSFIHR